MIGTQEVLIIIILLIILLLGTAIILGIYFHYKFKMANPLISSRPTGKPKNYRKACIIVGVSIGLILAEVLLKMDYIKFGGIIYFAILFLSIGISMLIANRLDKNDTTDQ